MSDSERRTGFGPHPVGSPLDHPPARRAARPPTWTVSDARGREIRMRVLEGPAVEEVPELVEMYAGFDRSDRAQGLPPADREGIREWLTALGRGVNLLADHDGRPVAHAALVPDGEGASELAIFVNEADRHARIGTNLLETLLSHAGSVGVEAVWLMVERHNRPAIALYANAGFETVDEWGGTMKMRLELDGRRDPEGGG